MKKTIKKLSLNKTTISNLDASEMNQKVGGVQKQNVYEPESVFCWSAKCQRFTQRVACTSLYVHCK